MVLALLLLSCCKLCPKRDPVAQNWLLAAQECMMSSIALTTHLALRPLRMASKSRQLG